MPGSLTALRLKNLLLGGGMTGVQLDTELTNPGTLGAYKAMIALPFEKSVLYNDETAFGIIVTSGTAFGLLEPDDIVLALQDPDTSDIIVTSTDSVLSIIENSTTTQAIFDDGTANTNLYNSSQSVGGSKLKVETFTTPGAGSYTRHTGNGLRALAIAVTGGGAAGALASLNSGGGAGAGFESVFYNTDHGSLPSSNTAYFIGSAGTPGASIAACAGTDTTVTGFISNANAGPGSNSPGGGTTVNGGVDDGGSGNTLVPSNWYESFFVLDAVQDQGGTGGTPNVQAGGNGFDGTGGGVATNQNDTGRSGTSPGAGASSGGGLGGGSTTSPPVAPAYGAGGGGGQSGVTTADGANGGPAVAIFYAVID